MKACGIFAASLFGALAAAAPVNKRDIVWVTETAVDIVTMRYTKTVWAGADKAEATSASVSVQQAAYVRPTWSRHGRVSSASVSSAATSTSVYVAPTTSSVYVEPTTSSSSSMYVAPSTSSVYVEPTTSSSSVYVEPTTSSVYVEPTTSSVYIEPTTSSVYVAPTTSSVYVVPTTSSVYVEPTTSSVYVATTTSSTSIYVAPTTSSTSVYVAPTTTEAPTSAYVAPSTTSSAAAATSAASSGSGAAAEGKSYTGDITYYATGTGACGESSGYDDKIVAISHKIFDDAEYYTANPNLNPLCGRKVSITGADGTQYEAKVVDRCEGCVEGDLDLSQGFFNIVTLKNGIVGDGRVSGMSWTWM